MMYICPKCGKEHTEPHDIDVMTEQGWDVQQNGCLDCWIETMCGRYPLVLDDQMIEDALLASERMDRYDPMA